MKFLKVTLLVAALTLAAHCACLAQTYAKIQHWGKTYPIDPTFFQIINANYNQYITLNAPNYWWYDPNDYNAIYVQMIDCFKDPKFTMIVTEANQMQSLGPGIIFPGFDNDKYRSKKSMGRSSWLSNQVVLPFIQQYVASYNKVHQFQY